MPLILAIEPERRQAAQLTNVVRGLGADLILVDTTERALDAIGSQVPDLVLVPALLSPQDDALLAGALRVIATAARVQMLTTPVLEAPARQAVRPSRMLAALRRDRTQPPAPIGCDPKVFADQISSYLERAAEERAAAAEVVAEAHVEAPIVDEAIVESSMFESAATEPVAPEPVALVPIILPASTMEEPEQLLDAIPFEATATEAIEPPAAEPPAIEPVVTTQPEAIEPIVMTQPDAIEPVVMTEPDTIEPVVMTEPDTIEPDETETDEPWPSWRRDTNRVQWPEIEGAPVTPEPNTPPPELHVEAPEPEPAPPTTESPRPSANTEREWVALIESLRQDVERLRAERQPIPEAVGPASAPTVQKPAAPARASRPASQSSRRGQKPRPIQDEWGFFDPDQCGFPALLAKLKEIEQAGGAPQDAAD